MANLAVGTLLTASEYNQDTFSSGDLKMSAAAAAPSGWVLCDGASYPRTGGTYDALFAAIGTAYGTADGSHFSVPDMQGRMPVGKGTNASVNALGLNDGVTVANRRAQHRHTVNDSGHIHNIALQDSGNNSGSFASVGSWANAATQNFAGGRIQSATTGITVGTATDALDGPAYLTVNYMIKL